MFTHRQSLPFSAEPGAGDGELVRAAGTRDNCGDDERRDHEAETAGTLVGAFPPPCPLPSLLGLVRFSSLFLCAIPTPSSRSLLV